MCCLKMATQTVNTNFTLNAIHFLSWVQVRNNNTKSESIYIVLTFELATRIGKSPLCGLSMSHVMLFEVYLHLRRRPESFIASRARIRFLSRMSAFVALHPALGRESSIAKWAHKRLLSGMSPSVYFQIPFPIRPIVTIITFEPLHRIDIMNPQVNVETVLSLRPIAAMRAIPRVGM